MGENAVTRTDVEARWGDMREALAGALTNVMDTSDDRRSAKQIDDDENEILDAVLGALFQDR